MSFSVFGYFKICQSSVQLKADYRLLIPRLNNLGHFKRKTFVALAQYLHEKLVIRHSLINNLFRKIMIRIFKR